MQSIQWGMFSCLQIWGYNAVSILTVFRYMSGPLLSRVLLGREKLNWRFQTQFFGNFHLEMRYCGILRTCSMQFCKFSKFTDWKIAVPYVLIRNGLRLYFANYLPIRQKMLLILWKLKFINDFLFRLICSKLNIIIEWLQYGIIFRLGIEVTRYLAILLLKYWDICQIILRYCAGVQKPSYCVPRKNPINREKTTLQTAAAISCSLNVLARSELNCDCFITQLTFQNQIKVFADFRVSQ